ncbi:MAG: class B sortase [Bacilli bacterium]|nr:class B sortase [Bacilli bacterium]
MIKKFMLFISRIFKTIFKGFYYDCELLAKGFFFYIRLPFILLGRIKNCNIFKKIDGYFKKKQSDPVSFLFIVLIFFIIMFLYTYLYNDSKVVYIDDSKVNNIEDNDLNSAQNGEEVTSTPTDKALQMETNLYSKYGKMKVDDINFNELKEVNGDVVAWLIVDGTSINYPIVQTVDNDYYLNHNIKKEIKVSGWTFMDFRNSKEMSDSNTIFYGHNLLNKTGFGSLSNVFTDKWFKSSNHRIIVVTENKRYVYEVFSCYSIEPEIYYLSNNFNNNSEYKKFLDTLVDRSNYKFNVNLDANDKIITLSTCTDDNKGRKVVHAKLIG